MSITFGQLPTVSKGVLLSLLEDRPIEQLFTDSRQAIAVQGGLFFAIKGENHDGHRYLEELYHRGIRQFVVEDKSRISTTLLENCTFFLVESSIDALQDIAKEHRKQFDLTTIAITGSNGKTIVKEWLFQLLTPSFFAVKSPKSYNSQIGVPLSVWQIRADHNLGIFEAGISKSGEMKKLERIIQPQMGIFTNIGPAHAEGFGSLENKIEEKADLFVHCSKIICCQDHSSFSQLLARFGPERVVAWSKSTEAVYAIRTETIGPKASEARILIRGREELVLKLPFVDDASVENLLHCIVVMLEMGIAREMIQSRILGLANIPMRLELKQGRNDSYIIDDTYNNDVEGLRIALQFMQQQGMRRNKVVILSDMLETGLRDERLYKDIATLLKENEISQFVGVGEHISGQAHHFSQKSVFFKNTEEALLNLSLLNLGDSLVLVKGARVFQFEKIIQALAQKIHRTVLEINLNALAHNLNVFRQMLQPSTKMMVMVKAFAYGSGSHEIAHLLQYQKVDYLAVAYTDEGVELRESNISIPIMVMNPTPEEFDKLVKYDLEPEIYSFRVLNALVEYINSLSPEVRKPIHVHIAIDTGMHRLGFEAYQIAELTAVLANPHIRVASVFSHLVGIDEAEHDDFSQAQASQLETIVQQIEKAIGYRVIKHLLNSAGITRFAKHQYDMVRLGIGLYGIENADHPQDKKLASVGTLKTVISQIRTVKSNDSVGYSRKGKISRDSRIATLAIGYADGYSRVFSNGVGKVWINGQLAPIVGNVCMDMCMVDVTDIAANEGEEAVIFGPQLPVNEVALWAKTIPYEILTNVSERIKRVFYMD